MCVVLSVARLMFGVCRLVCDVCCLLRVVLCDAWLLFVGFDDSCVVCVVVFVG